MVEGTRNPTSEKMLHLERARGASRRRRDDALPRQVLHDVRAHPRADPGRHRRGPGVPRRRRAGRRVPDHRVRSSSRTKCRNISPIAPPCSWRTTVCSSSASADALARLAQLVELTAEIVWGARIARARSFPSPTRSSRSSPATTGWAAPRARSHSVTHVGAQQADREPAELRRVEELAERESKRRSRGEARCGHRRHARRRASPRRR